MLSARYARSLPIEESMLAHYVSQRRSPSEPDDPPMPLLSEVRPIAQAVSSFRMLLCGPHLTRSSESLPYHMSATQGLEKRLNNRLTMNGPVPMLTPCGPLEACGVCWHVGRASSWDHDKATSATSPPAAILHEYAVVRKVLPVCSALLCIPRLPSLAPYEESIYSYISNYHMSFFDLHCPICWKEAHYT